MRSLRWIEDDEYESWVRIVRDSFPGATFPPFAEHVELTRKRVDGSEARLGGVFEDAAMVATFRVHDFRMNVFGQDLPASGLGGVATALEHRGRGIAKQLVRWCLDHAQEQGAALATLYPFRPSFYQDLGYGVGTPMHRYRLLPDSLPAYRGDVTVRSLDESSHGELARFYMSRQAREHGLFGPRRAQHYALQAADGMRHFGAFAGGELVGYLAMTFVKGSTLFAHDASVVEWHGATGEARLALLGFLRGLRDQVRRVVLVSQDEHLHLLLRDPMNGSDAHFHLSHGIADRGIGIMYRILDLERLLEQLAGHDFGGVSTTLAIDLSDTFLAERSRRTCVEFQGGRARVIAADAEVDHELEIGVGDLSSVMLGAVGLRELVAYGRARVADPDGVVDRAFFSREKPVCSTCF